MKAVFANSAWVPAPERLILRGGRLKTVRLRVRYGLVRHSRAGPVLIDTGYTPHAVAGPGRSYMLRLYGGALRPSLNEAGQPERLLARFGLTAHDVRFVIVTHFHADHISGLKLFPKARFIASDGAWSRLTAWPRWRALRHGVFPELLPADFSGRLIGLSALPKTEGLHGLPGGADLFGDGSMIAIDLPGHADGHFGILFPNSAPPLLYAVDAQWLLAAITQDCTPGLPLKLIVRDCIAMGASGGVLRRFLASGGEIVLCHDPDVTRYDLAEEVGA